MTVLRSFLTCLLGCMCCTRDLHIEQLCLTRCCSRLAIILEMDVEVRPSRVGCCITVLFAGAKNIATPAVVETAARLLAVGSVAHCHLAAGIMVATFDTLIGVYCVGAWMEVHAG